MINSSMKSLTWRCLPGCAKVWMTPSSVQVLSKRDRYHGKHLFPDYDPLICHHTGTMNKWKYVHGRHQETKKFPELMGDLYKLPVYWRRPRRHQRWEPKPTGSGDCQMFLDLDLSLPKIEFQDLEEFGEAPDLVKKILSLKYAKRADYNKVVKQQMMSEIRRHDFDDSSLEVQITQNTYLIRSMQRDLVDIWPKRNQALKHVCKILVDQRRVLLRRLREVDFKKFEWLLEKLNIVYKPRPYCFERVESARSRQRLIDIYCDEMKDSKTRKYKIDLKKRQIEYLKNKAETLRSLSKEEKDAGLEITITEEEIEECLQMAQQIESQRQKDIEDLQSKKYILYQEEEAQPDEIFLE